MTVSMALKQLRTELNMKQKDLAELLCTNITTVNRWEKGKFRPTKATTETIIKIAKEKGVSKVCLDSLRDALYPREEIKAEINDLRYAEIDRINQLVNESANGVVVVDLENHELLYVNNKAAQFLGRSLEETKNLKCYQMLMHKEVPCSFCDGIKKDIISEMEYTSEFTGRHYLIRGKRTNWGGRQAAIKYITDISESYRLQKELEQRGEMLRYAACFANMRVFKFDVIRKRAELISDFNDLDFFPDRIENYPEGVFERNIIARESESDYKQMVENICNGKKESEAQIKTKGQNGNYRWMRYRMNLISRDGLGNPGTAVCSVQIIE